METVFMGKYEYCHPGVVRFFNEFQLSCGGCHLLFLTSRPITHGPETRQFLHNLSVPLFECAIKVCAYVVLLW